MYMNKIKAKIVIFQESMEIFCYSWWKVESQQGLKPRASGIQCQRSNHWATETQFIDWQSPPWHITRLMLNKIRITLKTKLFKFFIHSQVWNILYFIHCKTGYRNILFSGHDYSCTETDIVFIWSCFVKQGPGSEAIKLTWSTHLISISLLQK